VDADVEWHKWEWFFVIQLQCQRILPCWSINVCEHVFQFLVSNQKVRMTDKVPQTEPCIRRLSKS
jgi:hypothetical protein